MVTMDANFSLKRQKRKNENPAEIFELKDERRLWCSREFVDKFATANEKKNNELKKVLCLFTHMKDVLIFLVWFF